MDVINTEHYIYANKKSKAVTVGKDIKNVVISGCQDLEEINLSDVTEKCCIFDCPKLQALNLPQSIKYLDINKVSIKYIDFTGTPNLDYFAASDCPELTNLSLQRSNVQQFSVKRCPKINICNLPKEMKVVVIEDTPIIEMKIPNVDIFRCVGTELQFLEVHPNVAMCYLNENKKIKHIAQPFIKRRHIIRHD